MFAKELDWLLLLKNLVGVFNVNLTSTIDMLLAL
jgi:hypothetical protein